MQGYNFTEDVRKALSCAREESARLRHEYVGTEHILLGLLRGDNVAVHVIESFDVKPEALADAVDSVVKKGASGSHAGPDLPYTSRAKKVLELAMTEARELNHTYVGTEHMLLGLLREEKGIAAQLLVDAGITLDAARERVLGILGQPPQPRPRVARGSSIAAMKVWSDKSKTPATTAASAHMAASIIELLAQDTEVGAVFAAQGIDVAKLADALRALAKSPPSTDRPSTEPPTAEPRGDSPPAP
jgi:ATP-dependent Clp protease ATP-binding subunit ClpC